MRERKVKKKSNFVANLLKEKKQKLPPEMHLFLKNYRIFERQVILVVAASDRLDRPPCTYRVHEHGTRKSGHVAKKTESSSMVKN